MARSRNIKPGFFTNDELAECDPLARLLFAGLWTEADREGRLEDRPKKIKAAILPYDSCDADELLNQLATRGFILRYQAGAAYIQITCFGKHQDPHYKEKASDIPAPPGHADTGKTAGAPSDELRAEIIARDGACVHCSSTSDLTLDHIIPRSKGGTHEKDNLQTLCRRCNSAKNNREARAIIGRSSANDPGGKSPLIPDSGFLIPDSSPLIPDAKITPAALPGPPPQKRVAAPAPAPPFDGNNAQVLNGKHVVSLAESWELPETWGEDAEALGWKPGEIIREGEKFRQYWVSGRGSGTRRSVKGWRQSWSTWLERAAKDKR